MKQERELLRIVSDIKRLKCYFLQRKDVLRIFQTFGGTELNHPNSMNVLLLNLQVFRDSVAVNVFR